MPPLHTQWRVPASQRPNPPADLHLTAGILQTLSRPLGQVPGSPVSRSSPALQACTPREPWHHPKPPASQASEQKAAAACR